MFGKECSALFAKQSDDISWPPYDLHLIYFWSNFSLKEAQNEVVDAF